MKMKYLKVEELEDGKFYYERLSKKEVLVTIFGTEPSKTVQFTYYSETSNFFNINFPVDYQLAEIE